MLPTQLQGGDSCARDSAKLEEILERDVAAGGVVLGQRGRINIKHYAAAIGCSAFVFEKRGLKQVTDRYEVEVAVSSNIEAKLPAIRSWLEGRIQDGSLGVRNGKVDRKEFCHAFGVKGGTFLVRNDKIREMFEEFDALVASGEYLPEVTRKELEALEPDPKVVEQYQYVVIHAVFATRWSGWWHGLVLPGVSIVGKVCDIHRI